MRLRSTSLRAFTLAAVAMASAASAGEVQVDIYSGFAPTGDGSPFSNLVGSHKSPYISFASDNWMSWHPFGMYRFGAQVTGTLLVAATGRYPFSLTSDDGSRLYIDGRLVIDNGFEVAASFRRPPTSLAIVSLSAGPHPFVVNFFEDFGGASGLDLALPQGVEYASGEVPPPGAGPLLEQLQYDVTGIGPGKSLVNKVRLAQMYYALPDRQATCAVLTDFVAETRAQQGKKIAADMADHLIVSAQAIDAAIGCR